MRPGQVPCHRSASCQRLRCRDSLAQVNPVCDNETSDCCKIVEHKTQNCGLRGAHYRGTSWTWRPGRVSCLAFAHGTLDVKESLIEANRRRDWRNHSTLRRQGRIGAMP